MRRTRSLACVDCMQRYLQALERSDFDTICALFGPGARVTSPFLGRMAPREFFDRVAGATSSSVVETPEIFVSAAGSRRGIGYFKYVWRLKDGTTVDFQCADVFEFGADGLIADLTIVYDTEPVRRQVGDKYR